MDGWSLRDSSLGRNTGNLWRRGSEAETATARSNGLRWCILATPIEHLPRRTVRCVMSIAEGRLLLPLRGRLLAARGRGTGASTLLRVTRQGAHCRILLPLLIHESLPLLSAHNTVVLPRELLQLLVILVWVAITPQPLHAGPAEIGTILRGRLMRL